MMNKLLLSTMVASSLLLVACGGNNGKNNSHKPTHQVKTVKSDNVVWTGDGERTTVSKGIKVKRTEKTIINGKQYSNGKIRLKDFGYGLSVNPITIIDNTEISSTNPSLNVPPEKSTMKAEAKLYVFQQSHSASLMMIPEKTTTKVNNEPEEVISLDDLLANANSTTINAGDGTPFDFLTGEPTRTLPTSGKYHYQGTSHLYRPTKDKTMQNGSFDYAIDFDKKVGQGNAKIGDHHITFANAPIVRYTTDADEKNKITVFGVKDGHIHSNKASTQGFYSLGVFGNNADEVTGSFGFKNIAEGLGLMGGTKK